MILADRLFARWYPVLAGYAERAGQRETRRTLVSRAVGRTLEVGAGSGFTVPLFPGQVTHLVLTEPSRPLFRRLQATVATHAPATATAPAPASAPAPTRSPVPVQRPDRPTTRLLAARLEALPFRDASFDTVVGCFVLCSITDPAVALAEVARVLRPGGRYLFLEHVRSPDSRALARLQDLAEPVQVRVARGCHPNRTLEQIFAASPLSIEHVERGRQPRSVPTVRPIAFGSAGVSGPAQAAAGSRTPPSTSVVARE